MTRRYFYTDPLAAAWMAKHFGMMFGIRHFDKFVPEPIYFNGVWAAAKLVDEILDFDPDVALYVHPDSLHLLEPKVGDMIMHGSYKREQDKNPEGWTAVLVTGLLPPEFESELRAESGVTKPLCYAYDEEIMICHRIIQRDGIAFHWPESESV